MILLQPLKGTNSLRQNRWISFIIVFDFAESQKDGTYNISRSQTNILIELSKKEDICRSNIFQLGLVSKVKCTRPKT